MATKLSPQTQSMELAVFNLPAVIRYDKKVLRNCLLSAINDLFGTSYNRKDLKWQGTCSEILVATTLELFNREPTEKEVEEVSQRFTQNVKIEFIKDDDLLEIRPGVQSVFRHMERKKNIKYVIVSDFWAPVTHFMLQSCGVFSKDKYTLTADEGVGPRGQLKKLLKKSNKFSSKTEILYINGNKKKEEFLGRHIHMGKKAGKDNYFTYPKFSDMMKQLRKS